MFQPGTAISIVKEIEKYKIKIVALQEIRWSDERTIDINDTTILYGKCNERPQFGVGFVVHKSLVHTIKEFKVINSRIAILIVRAKFFDIEFINVHAPTEEKSQEEKEDFYAEIEDILSRINNSKIRIILDDMNAKIRKEQFFQPTIGKHSLHETTNDNGMKLIDFATGKGFRIMSTMFPHKDIHKGTWKSPDGYVNQIDHILINERFINAVNDVRVYRGADCNSDHYLVAGKLNIKLKTRRQIDNSHLVKYGITKLENEEICKVFQTEVGKLTQLTDINETHTIESLWEIIKNIITKTSEEIIGKQGNAKRKPWFNTVCEQAIIRKKEARLKWLTDTTNQLDGIRYITRRKEAHNICRGEKKKYISKIIEMAESDHRSHRSRQLYHKVNRMRKGYKGHETFIRNKDGELITTKMEITERWAEHFEQLLNGEDPEEIFDCIQEQPNNSEYETPTVQEIKMQIKRLKNHKSPDEDGIQGEILKCVDETMIEMIHKLIEKIWNTEEIPKDWNMALICPIHKKDDKKVKEIKRLEWAGHVRRKPNAITKTALQENPRGKRPLGRPRMRWEDCVKKT
ncbi:hypothetical protein QTP88_027233 [Uroleucon formosanum]